MSFAKGQDTPGQLVGSPRPMKAENFELRREALLPDRKAAVVVAAADPVDAEGIAGDAVADRRIVGGAVGICGSGAKDAREHKRCELQMIYVVPLSCLRER